MKKLSLAALGMALVGFMAVTPSASAYDTATLERQQTIAANPAPSAQSCQTRNITLASYWYEWSNFMDNTFSIGGQTPRPVYLVSGTYKWKVCLYFAGTRTYEEQSYLDPVDPSYDTVWLTDPQVSFLGSAGRTSFTVYWGSQLVPLHA
ncbi:hypothetical protein [Streptomyces sp. NPDC088910]|uniref:hypothetical protein n=1 Tax=Streptomyces sp. NPDC088910 TaxID=3365911 RepID=UPI003824672D